MNREEISSLISKKMSDHIVEKLDEVKTLVTEMYVGFLMSNVYYKASWSDSQYPGYPSDEATFPTLDEAILWLSKESHPMGFTGCSISIGLYYSPEVGDDLYLQGFDGEKLARAKRNKDKK